MRANMTHDHQPQSPYNSSSRLIPRGNVQQHFKHELKRIIPIIHSNQSGYANPPDSDVTKSEVQDTDNRKPAARDVSTPLQCQAQRSQYRFSDKSPTHFSSGPVLDSVNTKVRECDKEKPSTENEAARQLEVTTSIFQTNMWEYGKEEPFNKNEIDTAEEQFEISNKANPFT
jgi:hypothetical protein